MGWVCSGVIFPGSISTSTTCSPPAVTAPYDFHVHTPPPKNQRLSPSPARRTTGATAICPSMRLSFVGLQYHLESVIP